MQGCARFAQPHTKEPPCHPKTAGCSPAWTPWSSWPPTATGSPWPPGADASGAGGPRVRAGPPRRGGAAAGRRRRGRAAAGPRRPPGGDQPAPRLGPDRPGPACRPGLRRLVPASNVNWLPRRAGCCRRRGSPARPSARARGPILFPMPLLAPVTRARRPDRSAWNGRCPMVSSREQRLRPHEPAASALTVVNDASHGDDDLPAASVAQHHIRRQGQARRPRVASSAPRATPNRQLRDDRGRRHEPGRARRRGRRVTAAQS